jgi:excisionase family DNA binding protein
MSEEHFLTTDELLDYLHINLRTVYRMIKLGTLPAVRIGRQWRFRKHEIDAWLAANESSRRADGDPSGPSRRPHVLVVDDEQAVCDLLAKNLAVADYVVDTVNDGGSAIDRLRAVDYDLLITDLKMPGMDGLTVIREARRLAPDLPIVVITAHSTEASAIEALNLGTFAYLTKPFRMPRILEVAARAVGEPLPAQEA